MPHRCWYAFCALAMVTALSLPAVGQTVISARSGVIHYFEGSVYLGDQPLESQPGRFVSMAQGDELRTERGCAEVLLTPGVLLRIGERSAIRMVANVLADTQAELLAGSAIVDSDEPSPGTSVTLIYKHWKVHFLERGTYRVDAEPPRLWVNQGRAEVTTEAIVAMPVTVGQGEDLPFAAVLVPEESLQEPADQLSDWSKGRSQSIAADNAIASQISDDPASMANLNLPPDAFTYFPLLGPAGLGPGLYGSSAQYQPGFNSLYLPGYTYQPFVLAIPPIGYGRSPYSPPRIGLLPGVGARFPGVGAGLPGIGARTPGFAVPRLPYSVPHPAPAHPGPHGIGGRVGGHR